MRPIYVRMNEFSGIFLNFQESGIHWAAVFQTSSIRTKMRPIYVRMKEFSWICLNLLELYWINLNSLFPDVLLSLSVDFRDIWETRDRRTTDGPRTDKASYRDAWTHLKTGVFPSIRTLSFDGARNYQSYLLCTKRMLRAERESRQHAEGQESIPREASRVQLLAEIRLGWSGCYDFYWHLLPSDGVDRDSRVGIGTRGSGWERHRDKMSLPAQARRPDSPPLSRSTLSHGSWLFQ